MNNKETWVDKQPRIYYIYGMTKSITYKDYHRHYYWSHPEYRQRRIEQSRERSEAQRIEDLQDYCCEPLENIENYDLAKADNFKGWHCHHYQLVSCITII